MNVQLLEKWRDDLRTTTEKQGKWQLGNSERGFCCLGRLCVVTGEAFEPRQTGPSFAQPIANDFYNSLISDTFAPIGWNDSLDMTFQEIADILDIILIDPEILT